MWDRDNGIETNWGIYLKHVYKQYVKYFVKMRKMEMQWEKRGSDVDVTPGRAASHTNT